MIARQLTLFCMCPKPYALVEPRKDQLVTCQQCGRPLLWPMKAHGAQITMEDAWTGTKRF